MAYTLTYSLGTITVIDTTLNTQTSLNLPGRNYAGYGAPVDQNQISLLENFASYATTGPANPVPGQTWYDTTSVSLKVNTSSNSTPTWQSLVLANSNNTTLGNLTVTGTLATNHITTGGAAIPGDITGTWTLTSGSSLNATYADLGERFEADAEYDAGTVMELGGPAEITIAKDELSEVIFGVISESAGMTMNSAAGPQSTHPVIAMTGRVPVKVRGKVKKGDRLVSAGQGFARSAKKNEATPFNTVGRSLENKTTDSEGTVLAAVSAKL